MPTNASKYAQEDLILKLCKLHTLNREIKDLMHTNVTYQQKKMEGKMKVISRGKIYIEMKSQVVKLLRVAEKKAEKEQGGKVERKIRLSRIHPKMSRFLKLKERNLPVDKYADTLVMSYFSDWVVREGRCDGLNVKLFGKDDWFVQLLREELSTPGSGPDSKDGTVQTSVLDKDGNIINPFPRCKHMVILKNLYVQQRQLVGDVYVYKREAIVGDEYDQCVHLYEKERDFLTRGLKVARQKYKSALDRYTGLLAGQENAKTHGDVSYRTAILGAKKELDVSSRAYTSLLNSNGLAHKISV